MFSWTSSLLARRPASFCTLMSEIEKRDQGSQYSRYDWQALRMAHGLVASMSRLDIFCRDPAGRVKVSAG
jgi:transposase InsO family protein